ncbi:autotransporter domain-containing protein [Serratia sp. Tan611]|uniref:autotransporter outer membrane beta-barrel domain-containing protein n=1 Tax=Serratia sp. Tan611 TaxID=2773264 RepID=UPI001932A705|nr:autotransporter domain-containing protein [Serratia sp. Tan611]CAE1147614.1 protein of unknown function [Serratia sp. Tan611]
MEKLWGHPSLPVKTRLSRLYIALAAALTLAGNISASYAENIKAEDRAGRAGDVDGMYGNERRLANFQGGFDVLNGKVMNLEPLGFGHDGQGGESTEAYVSGVGSSLHVTGEPPADVLALSERGRFSSDVNPVYVNGAFIIGSLDGTPSQDENGEVWRLSTSGPAQALGVLDADIVVDTGTYNMGMSNSITFNHTADGYRFVNAIIGDGAIANVAGNTELTGDLSRYNGHIFAKDGKLTVNTDIGTEDDLLIRTQHLYAEDGGTLILNGTIGRFARNIGFSTSLFVESGGVLGGNATIGRTVVERDGHFSPGDGGIGKFDINSYLTFNDGALYDVDIAADGRSDSTAVLGQTTIGKDVKVQVNALDPHASYQDGQTYRILTSEKDIAGTFSAAVLDSAFLDATLEHGKQFIDLIIKQLQPVGDAILDGSRHISQSVSYGGTVSVGQNQVSDLLIDGGTFSAKKLVVGSESQPQATVRVENGAHLVTDDATVNYGPDDTDYRYGPKVAVAGNGSEWQIANRLALAGKLDVLDGAQVTAGELAVADRPWNGTKSSDIYVSGEGSRLHSRGRSDIDVLSLADNGRFSNDGGRLALKTALIIGSRGYFDGHVPADDDNSWTPPMLGGAQAPGILDPGIALTAPTIIFNHTADDYAFGNTLTGSGVMANVAGQTILTGDLGNYFGDVFVKEGKLTINTDLGTNPDYQLLKEHKLRVEDGGTLILNGTMGMFARNVGFSTSLFVEPGGVLGGDATIGRTVVENGGHLSPGDGGIGKFDINSYLTFNDGAFYDVDIAADGRSDSTAVLGQTTIGKNVKVQVNALDPNVSYQDGQTYRILTSEKDIAGTFSAAVLDSAFLDATLEHGKQFVDLIVKQLGPIGDALLDGSRHISHSVSYGGTASVGQDKVSHLLIDGGTFSAKKLVVGSESQPQATVRVENGARLVTGDATVSYGPNNTDYRYSPKVAIAGKDSAWQVGNQLALAGELDVLDGAQVTAGELVVADHPWDSKKTSEIYISGDGAHLHSRGFSGVGVLSLANNGRFSNDGSKLALNTALIIGSRGYFDGYSPTDVNGHEIWTLPALGEAQAPGILDPNIVVDTLTYNMGMQRSIIFNHTASDYQFANTVNGDGTMVNVAGQTTLSGDLTGYNGYIFVKGGKLTVNGDMATNISFYPRYQELRVEDGGTLILNGTVGAFIEQSLGNPGFSSSLFVESGGVLGGNATIGRTVVERGGHLSPGDGDIGKLTVRSYLTFKDGAFYDVDIAADGRSDTVGMQGETTIGKNVKVLVNALDPHSSYQDGQTYRILTSGDGIKGMFSEAVLDSAFLETALTRDRQNVDLTIRQKDTGGGDDGHTGGGDDGDTGGGDDGDTGGGDDGDTGGGDDGHTGGGDDGHTGGGDGGNTGGGDDGDIGGNPNAPGIFQTVATSDNQWNTAGALSSLAQQGPSLGLYNSLLMLNAGQAREAFNQLSGEQYASVQSSLQQSGTLVGSVVNQHMQTMFDGDSLTVPPLAMSLVQGPERERNGAWGQMFGSWTRSKGDGNTGKLDSNTGGFLVGADRELSEGVRAGAYAGYSRTHFDVDSRASSGHSNNYHLGLYGAGQRDALALRGGLGYSWHRIESERNVGFGGYRDRLKGDYDGNTLQAFTELGYRLRYESSSVEPFVNLSYVRLHTDAVQEQGGAAALSVQDETMNTFYSTLGLRGATDIPVSGVDVTLHGNLGWQHAYGDTDTSARMAFATGDSFTSKGAPVDKDVAVVGVGLDVPLTRSTRVGVSYQGQYGSQLQANSVNAQLTVSF